MKKVLIIALLSVFALSGCSTIKGLGHLVSGVGDDVAGLSDAVKKEIQEDKK